MIAGHADPRGGTTKRMAFIALCLFAFAALLGLGTWQVQRLQWKEALIASINARINSRPRTLAELEAEHRRSGDVDYRPVGVAGVFEHENEQHFFATHRGFSGYHVYTPLRLADERIVFVNRGFVPFDRKDPRTRTKGQRGGLSTVSGLARNHLTEKPSWVVPENDLAGNVYYWKDIAAMARRSGRESPAEVVPFFVDADDTSNPGGLPAGGVTIIDLPNNHLQYAITWYGLAAALAGMFGFRFRRRRSGEDDSGEA